MKDRISEFILMFLIVLAPWAFGSVEAWAQLWLYAGIALVTGFNYRRIRVWNRDDRLVCFSRVALGGLVLLALFQAVPLMNGILLRLAPSLAAQRARLLPNRPELVLGDTAGAVALPARTLSLEPDSTLQTAAKLAAAWLLFQAVLSLRNDPGFSLRLAHIVVFNAAMLSLFAIVQSLTWNGSIYWIRPAHAAIASSWSSGGPFLNHSHLAAYLNMGLGLALGLLLRGNWRDFFRYDSMKLWTAYSAAIIAVGVISSHSRSGFMGLAVAAIVVACFLRTRLIPLGFGLGVALVMIGLCLALLGGSSSFGTRLATILDVDNEGYSSRLEIWQGALRAWWARPFWGSGFGVFPVAVISYLRHHNPGFFARAENEYVDMLVEGGTVGFMLLLAFVAGIAGLGRRAIADVNLGPERGVVGGAAFGLLALAVQSSADFAPHIPAVGVLAIVLCGVIARVGRAAGVNRGEVTAESSRSCSHHPPPRTASVRDRLAHWTTLQWLSHSKLKWYSLSGHTRRVRRCSMELIGLVPVALAVLLVINAVRETWVENRLDRAGLPVPGTYLTTVGTLETTTLGLDEYRLALEQVLRVCPNWSEGHLRLGMVHLGMYREMTREWLEVLALDPDETDRMAEPLRLLGQVHEPAVDAIVTRDVLGDEPVLNHLVPAAHCFLEARRCSPFLALPHAEIAALHYLLTGADQASTYVTRASVLAGNDRKLLTYLAQIAVEIRKPELAARCWRQSLAVDPAGWTEIADAAQLALSPKNILNEVTSDGSDAIRFADRLYPGPRQRSIREIFFAVAIERFAVRREMLTPDELFLEGHALASLGQNVRAGKQMETSLALEPAQAARRQEYIEWLLNWGRADEAHAQALVGRYFSPESQVIREAVDRTAEALARGGTLPPISFSRESRHDQ